MMDRFAAEREARAAIRHQALALGGAIAVQIGLARQPGRARRHPAVERNDVIAFFTLVTPFQCLPRRLALVA